MTHDGPAAGAGSPRQRAGLAIGVVLVLAFIAAEFLVISLQTATRPPLPRSALQPVLHESAADGRVVTWTNTSPSPHGGPLDLPGRRPVIAMACTGGGAIALHLSTASSITLDCARFSTAGPILLDHGARISRISVEATDGNPRYIAEAVDAKQ